MSSPHERAPKPKLRNELNEIRKAIRDGKSYLQLGLPQLPLSKDNLQPSPPWLDFCMTDWDQENKVIGEYRLAEKEGIFSVGYKLDGYNYPGKFGFISKVEIIETDPESKVTQHIILGLGAKNQFDVNSQYPIILGGNFDFSNELRRNQLSALIEDSQTKPIIADFLKDVLNTVTLERLQPPSIWQQLTARITVMDVVKSITGYDGTQN